MTRSEVALSDQSRYVAWDTLAQKLAVRSTTRSTPGTDGTLFSQVGRQGLEP